MKKVLTFSTLLLTGLILSQIIPQFLYGAGLQGYRSVINVLLSVALSFIMINVGREFILNKSKWRSYTTDYFIAMATAALPWILVCFYYMILMPDGSFGDWESWKNNLLLSRFAAPTSAGILFSMLAAVGLKDSWVYGKIQTLAIFDDLDTILLMIPLQIMMIGLKWELILVIVIVFLLLFVGWRYLHTLKLPQRSYDIIIYAIIVVILCNLIHTGSAHLFNSEGIEVEVLLPAFVLGLLMKGNKKYETKAGNSVATLVSSLFMLLVGMSMPLFITPEMIGANASGSGIEMNWGTIAIHVLIVTALSNIGKMMPLFFYRDRSLRERLALSIGMFTRGEVGAGIIFIAIGYNIGGPLLIISILTLLLNLLLTGFFVLLVRKLTIKTLTPFN